MRGKGGEESRVNQQPPSISLRLIGELALVYRGGTEAIDWAESEKEALIRGFR